MSDNFNLTRQDLMLLPWDEKEPPFIEPTREEIEEISKRFDQAAVAAYAVDNRHYK